MFKSLVGVVRGKAVALASAVGAVVLGPAAAFAQTTPTFDMTAVTATITAVSTAGAIVGAAYLAMRIGIRAWKWIAGAA